MLFPIGINAFFWECPFGRPAPWPCSFAHSRNFFGLPNAISRLAAWLDMSVERRRHVALPPFPLVFITGHKEKTHEKKEGPRCPNDEMFPKGTRENWGSQTDFRSLGYHAARNSESARQTP